MQEGELDEVIIGKEGVKQYEAKARWLVIGRLNTSRLFSSSAMFKTLKSVWNLAHEPKYREAGENLFVFQMFCLEDWKRVVHGGPWLFMRGLGLLIEDYDGRNDPTSVVFDGLYVCARIHKIPDLYRYEEVVDQLARRCSHIHTCTQLYENTHIPYLYEYIQDTEPTQYFEIDEVITVGQ